ncbi:MAG: hypothetical protein ACKORA_06255, partial [Solirubrobacterales bacterium]
MESAAPEIDAEYRQVREEVGQVALDRSWIEVSGPDSAEYLQSQVTNEVEALEVGRSIYAALLDRKGRIQADMRVTRVEADRFLIDCEPSAADRLASHLDTYRIGREVEVDSIERSAIALLGPATVTLTDAPRGGEGATGTMKLGGHECLAMATHWGVDLVIPEDRLAEVKSELEKLGVQPVSPKAPPPRPRLTRPRGSSPVPSLLRGVPRRPPERGVRPPRSGPDPRRWRLRPGHREMP